MAELDCKTGACSEQEPYGLTIESDDMEPRYSRGGHVFMDPGKPIEAGCHAVLTMSGASGFVVRRVKALDGIYVILEQYNPRKEYRIQRALFSRIDRVTYYQEAAI